MSPQIRIYWFAGVSVLTALAAVLLPRFIRFHGDGFAAAASAVLFFLGLLVVAFALSLAALSLSIRHYASLSRSAKLVGIGPAVLLAAVLVWVLVFLRY